ncbi:glycosyltransferase family A protein [Paludisphaera rhizosphaerae]|uniref:glycosyltransferase family A protein n=1 Tax=Paludisphaera rhizosphaerae TaxID=2711216 RepID=UPI0013EB0E35|nr:glycosyltransferase family A protein [Paludisphaera rhizosphaerae]
MKTREFGPESAVDRGRVAVVTGADSNYFWLLEGAVESLRSAKERYGFELVVLDFGLTDEEKAVLHDVHDAKVVTAPWIVDVPEHHKTRRNLAFGARCTLPDLLPGIDVFLWFDSDGWVQDDVFYERYIEAAWEGRLAIVREEEEAYPFDWPLMRWNLGNQILGFGLFLGTRVYLSPAINNGFFAAKADHPVWKCWRRRFESAVRRSGKIIMDQHSLKAAIALDRIPTTYLGGELNWICSRGRPVYDPVRKCFCLPYPPYTKIAVMHLAGHDKDCRRQLICVDGGNYETALTYRQRTAPPTRSVAEPLPVPSTSHPLN